MVSGALLVVTLGFVLGMRHATDADHVVAVTTIVSRQRGLRPALLTGLWWGIGHSLTVSTVGMAIILFKVAIPDRVGLGMELSVGAMLVVLGLANMAAFRPSTWRALARSSQDVHTHAHSHGDYVHTHPHGHTPETHPHAPVDTPLARLDLRFAGNRAYAWSRPLVIGVVHGLAGSAAVALLIAAAVREPAWAVAYLLVFGGGTIAGMMLVTFGIASALHLASSRSTSVAERLGFASGLLSVIFGVVFAWQTVFGA
jgi:hypothetical protein